MGVDSQFTDIEINFCKLFKETIRSRIIVRLMNNIELRIDDFYLDDFRLRNYINEKISKIAINQNLTSLKKDGFVKYRRRGQTAYWRLNEENKFITEFRGFFKSKKKRKRKSANAISQVEGHLSHIYNLYDSFKPAELKEKLGKRSYSISSARLSQVLKDLVEQDILEKEEKARYKIISKPGYDNYN